MNNKISGGYYIKARCIKNSAIAKAPPYVREIWDYLLREANHTDKKYSGFIIKRGQLFRSYRDIRNDLSWKVGYRVERYNENQMKMGMRYLMKQLMITLTKQPRGNIITICNYDFFQNPKNYEATSDTTNDTTDGQPMGNQGVLSINKNVKNIRIKETNICPQQDILNLYHTVLPEAIIHKQWNGNRAAALQARWNEKIKGKNTNSDDVAYWEGLFNYIRESNFLMGKVDPAPGHKRFRISLEWITKKTNFLKIIEGTYHGK